MAWGRRKFFACCVGAGGSIGFFRRLPGFLMGFGHPAMRMAAGVDFGESLDADVGVNLGGRELLVAEHLMLAAARTLRASLRSSLSRSARFLYVSDVRAAFQHISGAGMTEPVARSKRRDAGLFHESGDPVAEIGGTEARAVAAEKECGFRWNVGEERPDLREVPPLPPRGMSTRKM